MPLQIRFTREGHTVPGRPEEPPMTANDVHFNFTAGKDPAVFWYTKKGELVGEKHQAPKEARDIGLEFGPDEKGHFVLGDTHWTDAEHKAIGGAKGYFHPPDGADDWHFEAPGGQITDGYWTHNGESFIPRASVDMPKDVDDAHLALVPAAGLSKDIRFNAAETVTHLTQLTESVGGRVALARLFDALEESLPAPAQPCGEPFSTTGDGKGTDGDKALDDAYTKAAFAAGSICAKGKDGCTATEFVKYIKVSYGGVKGAVTCSIEAQFKCTK